MVARQVRIGVLGCGNVGAPFVSLIADQSKEIEARTGVQLVVSRVAVRNLSRQREIEIDPSLLTNDASDIVADPDIDLVVEVIGGIEPPASSSPPRCSPASPWSRRTRSCSPTSGSSCSRPPTGPASTCCSRPLSPVAIPIVRALRESLRGEPITRVIGIVNGTTNYILTKMTEHGTAYEAALGEAQRLGYAERDPTADVEGFDAGAKAAIMASIASGSKVVAGHVYHEGISNLSVADIEVARRLGYVVKLLAIIELDRNDRRGGGPRAPRDGAGAPPAGERPRQLQRGVRRG